MTGMHTCTRGITLMYTPRAATSQIHTSPIFTSPPISKREIQLSSTTYENNLTQTHGSCNLPHPLCVSQPAPPTPLVTASLDCRSTTLCPCACFLSSCLPGKPCQASSSPAKHPELCISPFQPDFLVSQQHHRMPDFRKRRLYFLLCSFPGKLITSMFI